MPTNKYHVARDRGSWAFIVARQTRWLGVVRDFMIEATIADRENIRIGNAALADMKSLGATLVNPVDFSGPIAEIMTAYEPNSFTQTFPVAPPAGTKPIDHLAAIASNPKMLPGGARGVNLRMLGAGNPRFEARYALDLYFKERGDPKFRGVDSMQPKLSPAKTTGCDLRSAPGH